MKAKKASGRNIPNAQRSTVQVLLRLPPDVADDLDDLAERLRLTRSGTVAWLLEQCSTPQRGRSTEGRLVMHYVIKLKDGGNNFLAELPDYSTPQWQPRKRAKQFSTAVAARTYLETLNERYDFPGYPVKIRTAEDLRQERMRLRSSLAWAVRVIENELPPLPDPAGDDGEAQSQSYFYSGMREARALLKGSTR